MPKIKNKDLTKIQTQKKFQELLGKGIPTELRGVIWQELIGNPLKITESLFKLLVQRAEITEKNIDKDPLYRKNLKVIEEDLHRTFGELGHFRYGNKLYQPLRNVLVAFSVIFKYIIYCIVNETRLGICLRNVICSWNYNAPL